jgi:tRNA-dihydrouridine synthase
MIEYKGEAVAVREMRGQLPWYVKGFTGASAFRGRLTSVSSLQEIRALFDEIQRLD